MKMETVAPKLQRYLTTIARRQSISSIKVGAVVFHKEKLALERGKLPSKGVEEWDIDKALDTLARENGLDIRSVRYLGYVDRSEGGFVTRQYTFELKPRFLKHELNLVSLERVDDVLGREESKMVKRAFSTRL